MKPDVPIGFVDLRSVSYVEDYEDCEALLEKPAPKLVLTDLKNMVEK